MTRIVRATAAFFALTIATNPLFAISQDANFETFTYKPNTQYTLHCVVRMECSVTLLPGEKVTYGVNSDAASWSPHVTYMGQDTPTASIVVRPTSDGLAANAIVDTTARRYYLSYESCSGCKLTYYSFASEPQAPPHTASASRQDTQMVPGVLQTAEPSLAYVDLGAVCNHDTWYVGAQPAEWHPTQVCTDGRHTYIQLPVYDDSRTDVPVLFSVDDTGNHELQNYTYDSSRARYVVDGVYPQLALVGGTSSKPWTLPIQHVDPHAVVQPEPTPTPIIVPGANPYPKRVLVTPPPATHYVATPVPLVTAQPVSYAPPQPTQNVVAMASPSAVSLNTRSSVEATPQPAAPAPSRALLPVPQKPVPIYDTTGAVVAYTTSDLQMNQHFMPVVDGQGALSGYTMVAVVNPASGSAPTTKITAPGQIPNPACPQNDNGWNTGTGWSRIFRGSAQVVDSFVTSAAIKHGGVSKGLFGFIKTSSPFAFIASQMAENYIIDAITAKACPRTQNAVNVLTGLSAVINAMRSTGP